MLSRFIVFLGLVISISPLYAASYFNKVLQPVATNQAAYELQSMTPVADQQQRWEATFVFVNSKKVAIKAILDKPTFALKNTHGLLQIWTKDGHLSQQGNLVHNKLDGTIEYWCDCNSHTSAIAHYKDGKLDGVTAHFNALPAANSSPSFPECSVSATEKLQPGCIDTAHRRGLLSYYETYHDNALEGDTRYYDKWGRLTISSHKTNGLDNGISRTWTYHTKDPAEQGQLLYLEHYKEGKKHGLSLVYDEKTGQLTDEENYVHGHISYNTVMPDEQ